MRDDENLINELKAAIKLRISKLDDEINKAKREKNIDLYLQLIQQEIELTDQIKLISRSIYLPTSSAANQSDATIPDAAEGESNHFLISIAGFLFSDKIRETALGCLEERFHNNCATSGKITAQLYLLRDILESVYPILKSADSKQFFFPLIQFFVFVSQLIGAIIVYGSAIFAFLGYLLVLIMVIAFLAGLGFSHPSTDKVYSEPCKISTAYDDSLQLRKDLRKHINSEEVNFSHKTIVQSIYNNPTDNCIVSR